MVIVLDGASFTISWMTSNVFKSVNWFSKYYWSFMYVNEIPTTPSVLMTMFTGKRYVEHRVWWFDSIEYDELNKFRFVWDEAEEESLKVIVSPIPFCRWPYYKNFALLGEKSWKLTFPSHKDDIIKVTEKLHKLMRLNVIKPWNLFIAYYILPDRLYHKNKEPVESFDELIELIKVYDYAFGLAKDLLNVAKPRKWLVVSDHSYICPDEFVENRPPKRKTVHIPEALSITNLPPAPKRPIEVYYWIKRCLHIA